MAADPLLDPRNPHSPYEPQERVAMPPARPPGRTPPNIGAMALFGVFVLVLVAGGFVFAIGGFGRHHAVNKPAPGVSFSGTDTGQPQGPNALGCDGCEGWPNAGRDPKLDCPKEG